MAEKEENTNSFIKAFLDKSLHNSKKILIIILIIFLIIIIIIPSDFEMKLKDAINTTADSIDPSSENYNPYGPQAYFESIYMSENSGLIAELSIDEMWENNSRFSKYLSSKDSLAYLLNAQIVTQYPYVEGLPIDELNGSIRFYRNNSSTPMKCVSKDELQEKIDNYNSGDTRGADEILNMFTIENAEKITIAYLTEDYYYAQTDCVDAIGRAMEMGRGESAHMPDGTNESKSLESRLQTTTLYYANYIRKDILPFNFLWSIIVMASSSKTPGNAEQFAHLIASMAYDGEINLLIDDNKIETTDRYNYTFDKYYEFLGDLYGTYVGPTPERMNYNNNKINIEKISNIKTIPNTAAEPGTQAHKHVDTKTKVGSYKFVYVERHLTMNPVVKVRNMKTWMSTYRNTAVYTTTTDTSNSSSGLGDVDGKEIIIYPSSSEINSVPGYASWAKGLTAIRGSVRRKTSYRNINLSQSNTIEKSGFIDGEVTSPKFNKEIIELFRAPIFSDVKNFLCRGTTHKYFIRAIDGNEDTANLSDIIKYILNKVEKLDDTEEEEKEFLDIYNKIYSDFTSIKSTSGGKSGIDGEPGQVYDFLLDKGFPAVSIAAILGNMNQETSHGAHNVKHDVWNSGHKNYGLVQWGGGRLTNLQKFAGKNDHIELETQLEFIISELNTNYTKVRDILMECDQEEELYDATLYFMGMFEFGTSKMEIERLVNQGNNTYKREIDLRYGYAKEWYEDWKNNHTSGGSSLATIGGKIEGNTYKVGAREFNVINGYVDFKQGGTNIPWTDHKYWAGTFRSHGCMPTSFATILSGLGVRDKNGVPYTPETLVQEGWIVAPSEKAQATKSLAKMGVIVGAEHSINSSNVKSIENEIRELEKGKNFVPLLVHATNNNSGPKSLAGGRHFMVIVDVREANGELEVYLANPGTSDKERTGWHTLKYYVERDLDYYAPVTLSTWN